MYDLITLSTNSSSIILTIECQGDTILITKKYVIVNNNIKYKITETGNFGNHSRTLGDEQYFVIGDNEAESIDSRFFGDVPYSNMIGRVRRVAF